MQRFKIGDIAYKKTKAIHNGILEKVEIVDYSENYKNDSMYRIETKAEYVVKDVYNDTYFFHDYDLVTEKEALNLALEYHKSKVREISKLIIPG